MARGFQSTSVENLSYRYMILLYPLLSRGWKERITKYVNQFKRKGLYLRTSEEMYGTLSNNMWWWWFANFGCLELNLLQVKSDDALKF